MAGVAAAVVLLDQVTKTWALHHLSGGRIIHLVWTLRLALSFNSGAAFGIGTGFGPFLVAGGVALVAAFAFMGRGLGLGRSALVMAAVGLVLGGAVGNVADRVLRDHDGAVIDFVDLQWWPVFNVADAAITVGAATLALSGRRARPDGEGTQPAGDERMREEPSTE
ncbi:MAG: signal peptidase II [Actinobacteria bacterium]|nr:signal peptidase II [Actinomycetota bacterium]